MTRDPFVRLALIAAVSVWVVGLAVAARFLGWPAAVAAGAVGVAGAAVLTLEVAPSLEVEEQEAAEPQPGEGPRVRQPEDGTRSFVRVR